MIFVYISLWMKGYERSQVRVEKGIIFEGKDIDDEERVSGLAAIVFIFLISL